MSKEIVWSALISVILGWLFGLLTPPISSRIDRYYKRKDLKLAIFSELKNISIRLTSLCFQIRKHLGTLDKPSIQWTLSIYEKYGDNETRNILPSIKKLSEVDEKEFNSGTRVFKAAENVSLGIKTLSLTFIDSLLENIAIFDSEFQRRILEVRAQIDLLNQEIENAKDYFGLTFNPEIMSTNKDILGGNLKNSYKVIHEKCKYIVDLADELIATS